MINKQRLFDVMTQVESDNTLSPAEKINAVAEIMAEGLEGQKRQNMLDAVTTIAIIEGQQVSQQQTPPANETPAQRVMREFNARWNQ